ncbi:MAG TPA: addiction module protein [Longimicrobiaceae bacterium]|jgi:hypothetical protein
MDSRIDATSHDADPHNDGEGAACEAAWAEEIRRRVRAWRAGEVQPIPGERVFEELKDLFR